MQFEKYFVVIRKREEKSYILYSWRFYSQLGLIRAYPAKVLTREIPWWNTPFELQTKNNKIHEFVHFQKSI